MFAEPEFWVAVGFVILMGIFAYIGVHRTVLTALDHRSERIKAELDDASRLKQEAADLLAQYKARKGAAFDLQAFHDDLLSHGTVPVSIIASEMLAE